LSFITKFDPISHDIVSFCALELNSTGIPAVDSQAPTLPKSTCHNTVTHTNN
jgi:hypothetical protein